MKVKMLVSVAAEAWSCAPGEEIELSDAEAARFVAAGYAEPVEAAPAKQPKPAPAKAKD